jgi:galactose-1-phosphate uridylyltransferase
MELRKDPITRSWVITGDDVPENPPRPEPFCRFCPDSREPPQLIASMSGTVGAPWSTRAVVHPNALYHIEGEATRRGDGIYDRMRPIGAHEVLVENPSHDRHLWTASDLEIEQFLLLAAQRIQDLKGDGRFKYVGIYKDHGNSAGQEFEHPTSQLTATTFVPRRVLYELRAAREYFQSKERCVFCDIISQELKQDLRVIELRGDFVAMCPYAPRVPYESWIMPRTHEAAFERFGLNRPGTMRALCSAFVRSLKNFTSYCTPRPTACTGRETWAIGRPSTRIITGTSKSCQSLLRRRNRILSKRFTIRRYPPRLPLSACGTRGLNRSKNVVSP